MRWIVLRVRLRSFALQQHLQLARSPVGITPPQPNDLLFQLLGRMSRAVPRTPAAFGNARQALLPVTLQPYVAGRTRYPELLTQRG